MNAELIFSMLLNAGRLFFAGWSVLLITAGLVVFRRDIQS